MRSDVKKISNKRLTKYQIKNTLAAAFSCLVFAGAATVGVMLILSETLYYEIEDFSLLPLCYKLVMLAGFLAVLAGLVGCLFTKNRLNTTRIEIKLNLCLFAAGFVLMLIFALLPTEARWAAVMIGIGGAVSTVGLFSGIASLIGFMKKPKSHYVSELIYKYYSGSLNDEDIVAWRQNKAYNKFVKWWGDVNEKDIENDEVLFAAYQLMWYYNEVCNGGFDQFWDFAENSKWDVEALRKRFRTLLPEDQFLCFEAALKKHMAGEDCEECNRFFDCDAFANIILPQIAQTVLKRLETRADNMKESTEKGT